jgi:hypothetical protein
MDNNKEELWKSVEEEYGEGPWEGSGTHNKII